MNEINYSERKNREIRDRSSSARNTKTSRDYKNSEYFGNSLKSDHSHPHLSSRHSKEYPKPEIEPSEQKTSNRNPDDNTEYIKNLYKKYLGKENQNKSQRKQRVESGVVRNLFSKENKASETGFRPINENIVIMSEQKTQESQNKFAIEDTPNREYCNSKYSLSKNRESISVQLPMSKKFSSREERTTKAPSSDFYSKMMNIELLEMLGDSRSSLILAMKNICRAKCLIMDQNL